MYIESRLPWSVTLFLRDVAEAARTLDGGRLGDWSRVESACARWESCRTREDRVSFALVAARVSRHYARIAGAYCERLAAYYRAISLAAFAGARGTKVGAS